MIYDLEDKKREGVRAGQSCLTRRGNPSALPEMAFLREKPRPPVPAGVAFWSSWPAPQKRGLGVPVPYVFGTWHVAVWIFGPKTRVVACGNARFLPAAPYCGNLQLET